MTRTARLDHLGPSLAAAVETIAGSAAVADGVAPLSEAFRIALRSESASARHLLRYAAAAGPDGAPVLVGYAQVAGSACELVVDPDHRRAGHGRALASDAVDEGAEAFWSHGSLPGAAALAPRLGFVATRILHLMGRPLRPEDRVDPTFPPWVRVERFSERQDIEELLALNAAAFAEHPEQGRLTLAGLRELMIQPWFDPDGVFLLRDSTAAPEAPPIGFHWTKIEAPSGGEPPTHGEVYVVGVHPAYRGRGLAGPLTRLGIAHLARAGLGEVRLYVDDDNRAARSTYVGTGFVDLTSDALYTRAPDLPR